MYELSASHIVGGELFYNRVSGNTYRITLKLFRDCNCVNCAAYGDPEYISVFDDQGNLLNQIGLNFPGAQSINPPIDNQCLVQPDVCVERAIYTGLSTFTPRVGGYTLVYQRCCRNTTISNILLDAGASYVAHIPGSEVVSANSSPSFLNFPPIYICNNAPLFFDHSATDPDGDDLRYELYTPFSGADANCPDPSPAANGSGCPTAPLPPPYAPVTWLNPFGLNNQLNNPSSPGNNLSIDSLTGLLTVTPNTLGQFVVGVKVKEYRNGVLLGETLRDFQFNVATCNIPIANIPSNNINPSTGIGVFKLNCDNYTINFRNATFNPPPASNPVSYLWDFGVPGITTDTSSLVTPSFTYPDTGTYRVMLIAIKDINAVNCADTTYADVKVYPLFQTAIQLSDTCINSRVDFADRTISTAGVINSWRWNFGDGSISTLANPVKTYTAAGTYNVTLITTNDKGCKDTATQSIIIQANPVPAFTVGSATCSYDTISFTNTTPGTITSYAWNFGNGLTSGLRDTALVFNVPGSYNVTLQVTDVNGCSASANRIVNVFAQPNVQATSDTIVCQNTSLRLFASGGTSYLWSPGALLNDSTIANPVATIQDTVAFIVRVTNANQCSATDTISVSLYPAVTADAGLDTSVCFNPGSFRDSVRLSASGGVAYRWSPPVGLDNPNSRTPLSRPLTNTTYTVTATDNTGCTGTDSVRVFFLDPALNIIVLDAEPVCTGDSVQLQVIDQGASFYNWTPPLFLSNPRIYNPYFFPTDTTRYILEVQNYCYRKFDTVTINVIPLPDVLSNNLDSICLGDSLTLNASNAVTYRWSPALGLSSDTVPNPLARPSVSTLYTLTGIDSFGCVGVETFALRVNLPSSILIQPELPFLCKGDSVQLQASGALTYTWSPAIDLSDATLANPVSKPDSDVVYRITGINRFGCSSETEYTLRVVQPVLPDVAGQYHLCRGEQLKLQAAGGLTYRWEPARYLSDSTISSPVVYPDSSQNYTVYISNECFTDSAQVSVNVLELPLVDAGNDTIIYRNTSGVLNGVTNAPFSYWAPDPGLLDPTELSTAINPVTEATYFLYAVSDSGCLNVDSVRVRVEPNSILLIPTAFSPNNDGQNDVFKVVTFLNVGKIIAFDVYNRWGERVFHTNNIEVGWDGTFRGKEQPLGVYVWYIEAVTPEGESFLRKGNITLVR